MKPTTKTMRGFTLLEVLLAGFIVTVVVAGAFIVFGALTEKANIFFSDSELRSRMRNVESTIRKDIERAYPTSEMEFYAELDGVTGPRFTPEPFADYGTDRTPDEAEPGYNGDPSIPALYNPDPACDDFRPAYCAPPPPIDTTNRTENNALLDAGEVYFDIDGNGRYTGEPFDDNGIDQLGGNSHQAAWQNNNKWDFDPTLFPIPPAQGGGFTFLHEFWNPALHGGRTGDFDGDGIYSPKDNYFSDPNSFFLDPTPVLDNPLTFMVDETLRMRDGAHFMQDYCVAKLQPGGAWNLKANLYDQLTLNYQLLSPFGFLDFTGTNNAADWPFSGPNTTNGRYDSSEVPLYDYFPGVVNNGDQDTFYLRTRVEIQGEVVPANVYYRIVFRNDNKNYAERFTDSNGDGIWNYGEPFDPADDLNGNGICDPIVDPGERRLQRIVTVAGQNVTFLQDLGPAVRFNVQYFDPVDRQYVEPFSDTGIDGLYDGEEPPLGGAPSTLFSGGALQGCNTFCPDWTGDNYFPGLAENSTENNGRLDATNNRGIPALTLTRNPFIPNYPFLQAPLPQNPGENPFEGIKKFGYPDAAGALVVQHCLNLYPIDSREQIPILAPGEFVSLEPIHPDYPYETLYPVSLSICPQDCASAPNPCPNNAVRGKLQVGSPIHDGEIFRFMPAAVFDDEGWLRCAGVRDNFAYLTPGDQVFVWGFLIPPRLAFENVGSSTVRVPVPPGYYTLVEKRGNRLRLDLSKVPGGAPTSEQLRGVPAIYRAPFLPPAFRIDFALEGESSDIKGRDLRIWTLEGTGFRRAGVGSQGTPPEIPIRGTVLTAVPGSDR